MQACRVLRNSTTTTASARTSVTTIRRTTLHVDSDHAKTTPSTAPSGHQAEASVSRSRAVSTLLQRTRSLLPRTNNINSSRFWTTILERSITELNSGSPQVPLKATIAVCGLDKWAGSHDLVTAVLEDPFTSDPTYSDILRNRWKNAPSCVNFEYGKPAAFSGELSSPSDWLQRFPYAIRITELPDLSSLSATSDETESLMLNSDVLLLLCDPVVTPLSDLATRAKHLLDKPNTILVLTSGSISDSHHPFVSRALSNMGCRPGHILFVDPKRALGAVTALQADPTSPSTIDRYQKDTLGSRISTIAVVVNEVLRPQNLPETSLLGLRQETVLSQVHSSLSASFRSVEMTKEDVDRVAAKVHDLLSRVQRTREETRRDVLGQPGEDDKIGKALSQSAKEMNALLGSLSFWKMVWRVDEIGPLVSAAVQEQWCKGLENQLILQTGRLDFTQRELSDLAFTLVSSASLRSSVLENQLQQLKHSPTHTLLPDSLTAPIQNRRNQLAHYTTTRLHREAQSAIVGTFGGLLSGAGLGWWLMFGEHILSIGSGTEAGTAIGLGTLLAVSSIRWAVGRWERAKGRWIRDSARIGEGLTRDLQSTIDRTLDDNVTVVARTACTGMQNLIDRRRAEIHELHAELCELDADLRTCTYFPASWTRRGPTVKQANVE